MTNALDGRHEFPWAIEQDESEEYWRPNVHYNVGPAVGIRNLRDAQLIASVHLKRDALIAARDLLEKIGVERGHGATYSARELFPEVFSQIDRALENQ